MLNARLSTCLLSLFIFISNAHAETNELSCHPAPNPKLKQYVIGYGSLMQAASKNNTDPTSGENKPVIIDHYQRGWLASGAIGFSTTFLGVIQNQKAHFNGTIFSLASPNDIKSYDQREIDYCRVAVPASYIHGLDHHPLPKGEFWIYLIKPEFLAEPSKKYPIVQSYVDIFLSGCLELEQKYHLQGFADECFYTTSNWSSHWVNDRIYPRRPFVFQPNAMKIDNLLFRLEPKLFNQIKIES